MLKVLPKVICKGPRGKDVVPEVVDLEKEPRGKFLGHWETYSLSLSFFPPSTPWSATCILPGCEAYSMLLKAHSNVPT